MHAYTPRPLAALALTLLAASSLDAAAQTRNEQLSRAMMSSCPKMIAQLTGRPEMAPVLSKRPVDSAVVCGCTETLFGADERMLAVFNLPPPDLQARLQSPNFRAYVFVRLTHSVLACLNVELEASLAASNPQD